MEHHPRNVLVTGGAGFIGCNFVRHLLATEPDARIVTLDLLTYAGSLDNLRELPDPTRHTFVQGDICDRPLVDRLLREHAIDTIAHFAAESHVDRSITGPAAFVQTNLVGTFTLLEAARGAWLEGGRTAEHCRFHPFPPTKSTAPSSTAIHRSAKPRPTRPTRPIPPPRPVPTIWCGLFPHLRPAGGHHQLLNNYGPFQHGEKFIPTVIRSCLLQRPIPVYGDGSNIRDWLYVEDHCRGIDAVIRRGKLGETYNIGGDNEWANINIAADLRAAGSASTGTRPARAADQLRRRPAGHDWRYAIDPRKMSEALSWRPAETFNTGIAKTVDWYLERHATDRLGRHDRRIERNHASFRLRTPA